MNIKTEGGSGGKRGHSNMTHYDKTAVVKAQTRKGASHAGSQGRHRTGERPRKTPRLTARLGRSPAFGNVAGAGRPPPKRNRHSTQGPGLLVGLFRGMTKAVLPSREKRGIPPMLHPTEPDVFDNPDMLDDLSEAGINALADEADVRVAQVTATAAIRRHRAAQVEDEANTPVLAAGLANLTA